MNETYESVLTYVNDNAIKKCIKKISLKKIFKEKGVNGVIELLKNNSGVVKTDSDINLENVLNQGIIGKAYKSGKITPEDYKKILKIFNDLANSLLTTVSLIQFCLSNPVLAVLVLIAIIAAGGVLVFSSMKLKESKTGTIEDVVSMIK